MKVVLTLALAAPVLPVIGVAALPAQGPVDGRRWIRRAGVAAALLWGGVLLAPGVEVLGRFRARPLAAAAALGVALLAATATSVPERLAVVLASCLAWFALVAALVAGVGDHSALPLVGGLALAAAVLWLERDVRAACLVAAGTAAVATGLVLGERSVASFALTLAGALRGPGMLVSAGALALLAGACLTTGMGRLVAPVGLAIGLDAAGGRDWAPGAGIAALAVAGALVAEGLWRVRRVDHGDEWAGSTETFGRFAACVLVAGAAPAAAALLGAATVLRLVLPPAIAAACALPGAVVLARAAVADPGGAALAGSAAAAAFGAFAVTGAGRRRPAWPTAALAPHQPGTMLGLLAGAWLLVAPATWGWVGDAGLAHWDRGALIGVAGALLAVTAASALGQLDLRPLLAAGGRETPEPAMSPPAVSPPAGPAWRSAGLVALVAMGAALVALVRSALRSF